MTDEQLLALWKSPSEDERFLYLGGPDGVQVWKKTERTWLAQLGNRTATYATDREAMRDAALFYAECYEDRAAMLRQMAKALEGTEK